MSPILSKHSDYAALIHLAPQEAPGGFRPYNQASRTSYTGSYMAGSKKGFESFAFSRLFDEMEYLGINTLYRCQNARTDGCINLAGRNATDFTLIEVKTTLGWGSLNAALGAFISGTNVLKTVGRITEAKQGLIVFNKFSVDWVRGHQDQLKPWAMLYRHLMELDGGFQMAALQITHKAVYNPFLNDGPLNSRIGRLFRPYLGQGVIGRPSPPKWLQRD